MNRKEYLKVYWQRDDVKKKKMLSQRENYHSEKNQEYEYDRRRTAKSRWMRSKCNARARKKSWTISLEDFAELIQQPCAYCNASVEKETGSSLDRKDNDKGYHIDNVNTCCKDCNRRRSKSMGANVFKEQSELNNYKKVDKSKQK